MIVVDTHIIIWNALKPELLSKRAEKAIVEANNSEGILFCEISLWEIAMLMQKERIKLEIGFQDFVQLLFESNGYILKGITPEIAELSTQLFKDENKDPADRIISATTIVQGSRLVTSDRQIRQSTEVITIW